MMSDRLLNEYLESLGQNGPFLQSLFKGQHEQLQQLKESNAFLQTWVTVVFLRLDSARLRLEELWLRLDSDL